MTNKYIIFIFFIVFILVMGCTSTAPKEIQHADEFNCTINGVAYNVTSGICHGFNGTEPFTNPDLITWTANGSTKCDYLVGISDTSNPNGGMAICYNNNSLITTTPTPTPIPTPAYVTCSRYNKVIEKWKTPDESFVKIDDNSTILLVPETVCRSIYGMCMGDDYNNITLGSYVRVCYSSHNSFCLRRLSPGVKLKPVSESKSGYRDACEIIS